MAGLMIAAPAIWPRKLIFAATVLLGLANGLVETVYRQISQDGLWPALLATFGISAIVWISAIVGLEQISNSSRSAASWLDMGVAGAACVAFFIPASKISWVVLTALSLYIASTAGEDRAQRRGGTVILAITFPMFWSKLLFAFLSEWLLKGDAALVGLITGLKRVGNTLDLGPKYGQLWIASGCSSLANISLCVLCWTVFVTLFEQKKPRRALVVCLCACMAVVSINVCRISLIALHPAYYDVLHGPIGSAVAGWATTFAIVGICFAGLDRENFAVL